MNGWPRYALVLVSLLAPFSLRQAGLAARSPNTNGFGDFYDRTTNVFAVASFFKPAGTNDQDLAFKLAPLILQEVRTNGGASARAPVDLFGAITIEEEKSRLDCCKPTVYYQVDNTALRGQHRARFTYVWFYTADGASRDGKLGYQGVSFTLGASGKPALWEVLADTSGLRLWFVSESIEAAAAAEFGKPVRGRRHAVECPIEQTPETIVARAIDDGPVAMGPIIYLAAQTRDATSVICRCMPAQASRLDATFTYELVSLQTSPARPVIEEVLLQRRLTQGSPSDAAAPDRWLRLPSKF